MMWKAVMKDGKTIYQFFNGKEVKLNDLDKDNLDVFALIDTKQALVMTDLATGDFNFNNLDLTKLEKLSGNEKLELNYDNRTQKFKLSTESLEFLNDIVLSAEKSFYLGFDQTGQFNISGIPFCMGFEINGKLEKFINKPPYNNIIQTNEAFTDFIGDSKSANPYKKIDGVIAYNVGYKTEHPIDNVIFKLSIILHYNVIQKCVSLNSLLTASENISGKLCVFYDNKVSKLDVNLYKNEPARLDRIITLL